MINMQSGHSICLVGQFLQLNFMKSGSSPHTAKYTDRLNLTDLILQIQIQDSSSERDEEMQYKIAFLSLEGFNSFWLINTFKVLW